VTFLSFGFMIRMHSTLGTFAMFQMYVICRINNLVCYWEYLLWRKFKIDFIRVIVLC